MAMDRYTIGWLTWGASLCVLEGVAIAKRNPNGMLTTLVRRLIGASDEKQTWWSYTRRGAFFLFMSWLTGHFVFGLPGVTKGAFYERSALGRPAVLDLHAS